MCSAVTSVWLCVRLLQFLAVCSAATSVSCAFGRFKYWAVSVLLFSSCFYLYAFLPVSGFAHSVFLWRLLFSSWYLPFCLGMFYLALVYFLGRFIVLFFIIVRLSLCIRFSFTFSACLFCFLLVMIFVFFCFARTLVACVCLGARLFCCVIVVVSAFCSMQCGLVSHHLSLVRISVFLHGHLAFLRTIDMRISLSSLCLVF